MKLTGLLRLTALLFTVGSIASPAGAALVDFRAATFTPDSNATEFITELGGITWTFTANPEPATLYWDNVDGFGVRHDYETDEIEGLERLNISFSEAVLLKEIHLTDLFNEHGYLETGWYDLEDLGAPVWFVAESGQTPSPATNGVKVLNVNQLVTSISFGAPGLVFGQNHEFSVSGLDVGLPIPEPASWVLFLAGTTVVGLALRHR